MRRRRARSSSRRTRRRPPGRRTGARRSRSCRRRCGRSTSMRSWPSALPVREPQPVASMVRFHRPAVDAHVRHAPAEVEEQGARGLVPVKVDDRPAPVGLAARREIDRERIRDAVHEAGTLDGLVSSEDISIRAAGMVAHVVHLRWSAESVGSASLARVAIPGWPGSCASANAPGTAAPMSGPGSVPRSGEEPMCVTL